MNKNAQRLDVLMDRRRLDRVMRWKDVATEVGVTQQTLLEARKGKVRSDLTAAGIERFMEWAPGSVRAVLEGRNPTPLPAEAEAGAGPLAASVLVWEGELRAPEDPLHDGEVLRWRKDRDGRRYRLEDGPMSVEYVFGADEVPEEVIDDLRDLLDQYRVHARVMERRRARR